MKKLVLLATALLIQHVLTSNLFDFSWKYDPKKLAHVFSDRLTDIEHISIKFK